MSRYGFGVDVGGTTIKMGFFDIEKRQATIVYDSLHGRDIRDI